MVVITDLPPEIIHNVLRFVGPPDLAWLPRVCKTFNYCIKGNTTLFKSVYLEFYDTPQGGDIDWEQALKNVTRLQAVCRRQGVENKKHELPFVYETVNQLLQNASSQGERANGSATHALSRNAALLTELLGDRENQHAFLQRSFIHERARGELACPAFASPPRPAHQQSAKLHCLYGVPLLQCHRGSGAGAGGYWQPDTRQGRMGPFACSKVYDLRQYTAATRWGPFMDDGSDRADWEKVEAVMIVLGQNLNKLGLNAFPICKNFWGTPFAGVWPNSYMALPMLEREAAREDGGGEQARAPPLEDPYGITGTWLRVVCFLDYTDFFDFNFNPADELPPGVPRRAINYGEATRLILMKISVTAVEPPGPEDGQALPVVHFRGLSRSLDDVRDENGNSDLRGTVRLTREGEVRWTTWSLFNGQERWRSESIQVGGVKSAKGVIGNWFDKDFDPRGPAGPTAFWKISDKVTSEGRVSLDMYDEVELPDGDYNPEEDEVDDDNEDEYDEESDEVEIELVMGSGIDLDLAAILNNQ